MKRLISVITLLCAPAFASLSEITGAECVNTAGTSCTLGTHAFGDLEVTFSYRSASSTAPSLPAGYTNINNGGVSNSTRTAYRFLDGTETVTGTFTNATSVTALVFRGADITSTGPIGGNALGGATSAVVSYTTLTMTRSDGTSWVVGFDGCASCTAGNNAPTGMTLRQGGGANKIAASSTAGGVSSWATTTVTVTTSGLWRSQTVEILASPAKTAPPIVWRYHSGPGYEVNHNFNTFKLPVQSSLPANHLRLFFSACGETTSQCDTAPPAITSVVDNNSTTWTQGIVETNATDLTNSYGYYCNNCSAGVTMITVTFASAAVAAFQWDYAEFNKIATSTPIDGTSVAAIATAPNVTAGSIITTVDGDTIDSYCIYVSNGFATSPATNVFIPGGSTFLNADQRVAAGTQAFTQTTHVAISPFFQFTGTAGQDMNCLAMAYKASAGSGTAPASGIKIINEQWVQTSAAASFTTQFPCEGGNLIVGATSDISNKITAMSDSLSNSYTLLNATAGFPSLGYAQNATTSNTMTVTMTLGTSAEWARLYCISGAATTAIDSGVTCGGTSSANGTGSCKNSGTQSGVANITDAPTIVPSTSNGLLIAVNGYGSGPPSAMTSTFLPDFAFYTNETDTGLDHGDGWAHFYNSGTSSENWGWVMSNSPGGTSWNAIAAAFQAPASAAKSCTITLMGAGPC